MKKNGFTLMEVLIAMFVGAVIMSAVYGLMVVAQRNSANTDRKVVTQQDTRTVLDLMAMEIRMASFNPTNVAATWNTIPSCAQMGLGAGPIQANKGIQIANANAIVVAMDLNSNGTIGNVAGDSEYIMYSYDGASILSRNVKCGGDADILGGTAPFTNVRNAAAGVSLFQYFDRNDSLLAAPVNIPAIRRILITIVSDTTVNDANTGQPRRMIYSTNVMVRNHVLSP